MITTAEAIVGSGAREIIVEVARVHDYENLKEEQLLAMAEFVPGRNVLVSLPTGFGKSLIYGLTPLVIDRLRGHTSATSIALVVRPSGLFDDRSKSRFLPRGFADFIVGRAGSALSPNRTALFYLLAVLTAVG